MAALGTALACAMPLRASADVGVAAAPAEGDAANAYEAAIAAALEEFQLEHWQEAIVHFERAHALSPSARTHRGLGLACFEARQYDRAVTHLRAALDDPRKPLTAEQRRNVERALQRTLALVGEVTVEVAPEGARLFVDGARRDPDAGPLVLLAGEHSFELEAAGHPPLRRVIAVAAGTHLRIELAADAADGSRARSATPASARDADSGAGAWPWLLAGASAGAAVAGGLLLASALDDIDEVEDAEVGSRWMDVADAHDAAPGKSTAGIILSSAGGVGLTAALLWALLDEGEQDERTPLQLGLRRLHGGGELELRGRF
jgi:tetratricopeptide (TPR) repeat protein